MLATSHAAVVQELNWNTSSGLLGVQAGGAQETGLTVIDDLAAATSINGTTGVLTSSDVSLDPQLTFGGTSISSVALPTGFSAWESIDIRFRQLTANPGATGVAAAPFSGSGVLVIGRVDGTNSLQQSSGFNSTGPVTTTTEATGEWVNLSYDFSGVAPTSTIGLSRFDPVGNNGGNRNFEIDFIRVNAVAIPEPSSAILLALGSGGLAMIRRRRKRLS